MKAHVLFDDRGEIHGVLVPSVIKHDRKGLQQEPFLSLRSQKGQRSATLEIPQELQHLKPRELHSSARVEGNGDSARLVSKA
jgi:hypothetical protein